MTTPACQQTGPTSLGGCLPNPTLPGCCVYCGEDYLPGDTARQRLDAMVQQLRPARPWWRPKHEATR